jgi:hypothetical protein
MAAAPNDAPIRTGARLPWEPAQPDAARVFSNAAESLTAAAAVVDLVIEDLRGLADRNPRAGTLNAIRELYDVRTSLRDIADKARAAARRQTDSA